jgi:hypothetical protein
MVLPSVGATRTANGWSRGSPSSACAGSRPGRWDEPMVSSRSTSCRGPPAGSSPAVATTSSPRLSSAIVGGDRPARCHRRRHNQSWVLEYPSCGSEVAGVAAARFRVGILLAQPMIRSGWMRMRGSGHRSRRRGRGPRPTRPPRWEHDVDAPSERAGSPSGFAPAGVAGTGCRRPHPSGLATWLTSPGHPGRRRAAGRPGLVLTALSYVPRRPPRPHSTGRGSPPTTRQRPECGGSPSTWPTTAPAGPGRWRHGVGEPRMPAMETSPLLGSCRVG